MSVAPAAASPQITDGSGLGGPGAELWVWPVVLLVGLALLALGLVLLRRTPASSGDAAGDADPPSTARATLDERLARGEIDVDEHARRRAVLDED